MLDSFSEIHALLKTSPNLFIGLSVLIGLIVGSFLNVLIYRLPKMMEQAWQRNCQELNGVEPSVSPIFNLITPPSSCPQCGHRIGALENIPVLSYVFLQGKCSQCKTPISLRYPLIELLSGTLLGLIAWQLGYTSAAVAGSLFALSLLTLTFIDLDTQLLPDDITLPLLWLGLIFNFNYGFTDIQSAVMGAVIGYLTLWSIYWMFKLITGKEGMGYGDFKMLAAIGAWFGWQMIPAVILLSSILGALVGIGLILLAKRGKSTAIPFGPFLAMGGIGALFFGQQLSQLVGG